MKTLIFGRGFLGDRFARSLEGAILDGADIADERAVRAAIDRHAPDAVINTAGRSGRPNVDWCESHKEETYRSNVEGPLVLARVCASAERYLLHVGSGCVFFGRSPASAGWREEDPANAISFYSRTKYAADLVLSRLPATAVLRIRMPIDGTPHARNLITKLASYPYVIDVENSVTFVDDLIRVVSAFLARRLEGTFHVTNPGPLRHSTILEAYRDIVDPHHTWELIAEHELLERGLARAARSSCVLSTEKLAATSIVMRPAHEALAAAITSYASARALGRT